VLGDWLPWEECTKACNKGITIRRKPIVVEKQNDGECAGENDPSRFEYKSCNPGACPPNLVCNSMADVVFVLDGSGSVGERGFLHTKTFAKSMISRMNFGDTRAKAGTVRFSSTVDIIDKMTFDPEKLTKDIEDMSFPRRTTATSMAIVKGLDVLAEGGRKEVAKDKSILMILTDGMPNDSEKTAKMAEVAKTKARVVFAAVGPNLDEGSLLTWASFPPEVNVLHAKNYVGLPGQVSNFLADICPSLECREDSTETDMSDYIGCQSQTVNSRTCQKWTDQLPHAHKYKPNKKGNWPPKFQAMNILGGHNYCRNPDGKEGGIWCYTTDTLTEWEYCNPRVNTTSWEPMATLPR